MGFCSARRDCVVFWFFVGLLLRLWDVAVRLPVDDDVEAVICEALLTEDREWW